MKYDPKHLTYEDALEIEKRGLAVTAKNFEDGSPHTGPLRHMTLSDALKSADMETRLMMIAAITTSGLEYFYIAVREPGFNYDLPAIVFRRDGSIDDNYIIGSEDQSTSGVEINADELMDRLVKQETPAADADKSTSDRQTDEWKAKLPKGLGIYKAATGSVWLHSGNMWTPILNRYGNVPPSATPQDETGFAISSHKAKRFPFEKVNLAKLPTEEGYYLSKDRTKLFLLDRDGFWTLVAYMGARLDDGYFADTDKCSPCDDLEYVPVASHLRVTERNMREYAPLSKAKLGLRKPRLKSVPICEAGR